MLHSEIYCFTNLIISYIVLYKHTYVRAVSIPTCCNLNPRLYNRWNFVEIQLTMWYLYWNFVWSCVRRYNIAIFHFIIDNFHSPLFSVRFSFVHDPINSSLQASFDPMWYVELIYRPASNLHVLFSSIHCHSSMYFYTQKWMIYTAVKKKEKTHYTFVLNWCIYFYCILLFNFLLCIYYYVGKV